MKTKWLSGVTSVGFILLFLPCSVSDLADKGTSIGCVDSRCFFYIEEEKSWEDALSACRLDDGFLATVDDEEIHDLLSDFIEDEDGDISAWIGGRHRELDDWTWLSGNEFDGDVDEDSDDPTCGAIDGSDDEFEVIGSVCTERKPFICGPRTDDQPDRTHCIDNLAISYEEMRWHQAREQCRSQDQDLAVLENGCDREAWAFLRADEDRQEEFWVGLYLRRWMWVENGEEIVDTYFGSSEPDGDDEECLMYCKNGLWCDDRCSESNSYICETNGQPASMSLQPTVIGFALIWTLRYLIGVALT